MSFTKAVIRTAISLQFSALFLGQVNLRRLGKAKRVARCSVRARGKPRSKNEQEDLKQQIKELQQGQATSQRSV
jgi:hypothetical protein